MPMHHLLMFIKWHLCLLMAAFAYHEHARTLILSLLLTNPTFLQVSTFFTGRLLTHINFKPPWKPSSHPHLFSNYSNSCFFLFTKILVATMAQVFFISPNTVTLTPFQNIVICWHLNFYYLHSLLLQLVPLQRALSTIGWQGSSIGMLSMVPHGMVWTCSIMFVMDLQSSYL